MAAGPALPRRPADALTLAHADGMAVASFVLGLVGLLVMNILLGPIALVLSGIALWRGTRRMGRAFLGLALGVADLVVLLVLADLDRTLGFGFH